MSQKVFLEEKKVKNPATARKKEREFHLAKRRQKQARKKENRNSLNSPDRGSGVFAKNKVRKRA